MTSHVDVPINGPEGLGGEVLWALWTLEHVYTVHLKENLVLHDMFSLISME